MCVRGSEWLGLIAQSSMTSTAAASHSMRRWTRLHRGIVGGTGSPKENGSVLLLLLALEPFQGLHACMKIL